MQLARALTQASPTKFDTPLGVVVKLGSALDSINTIVFEGQMDTLTRIGRERDLTMKTSEPFVQLYFHTTLRESFDERRIMPDNTGGVYGGSMEIVHAIHPECGEVYFCRMQGPQGQASLPSFYHSKDFDFERALSILWEQYDGRIQATVLRTIQGPFNTSQSTQFSTFSTIPNPLYGPMHARMEHLVERQRRFKTDKVARSYMFYGDPGTGKSSFAEAFAERLGERTLRIDASALALMSVEDMNFLIKSLRPEFLLIDDMDKANMSSSVATLLSILQRFKTDYPDVTVLITANAITMFDPGFFRPGRIDTWIEFKAPTDEERTTILADYCKELKIATKAEDVARLVEASKGLTHDYVREIAYELRCDDVEHVVEHIEQMRALLGNTRGAPPFSMMENGAHGPFGPPGVIIGPIIR